MRVETEQNCERMSKIMICDLRKFWCFILFCTIAFCIYSLSPFLLRPSSLYPFFPHCSLWCSLLFHCMRCFMCAIWVFESEIAHIKSKPRTQIHPHTWTHTQTRSWRNLNGASWPHSQQEGEQAGAAELHLRRSCAVVVITVLLCDQEETIMVQRASGKPLLGEPGGVVRCCCHWCAVVWPGGDHNGAEGERQAALRRAWRGGVVVIAVLLCDQEETIMVQRASGKPLLGEPVCWANWRVKRSSLTYL